MEAGGKRGEMFFFFLFLWLSLLGHGSGVAVLLTESHIPCQVAPASAAARTGSGRPLLLQAWLVTAFLLPLAPSPFASPSLLVSRKPTNTFVNTLLMQLLLRLLSCLDLTNTGAKPDLSKRNS